MPVLSLPLPRLSPGIVDYLPIRVPFPFMRIASILPHAINEPMKTSLLALFRLAWSAKVQLPVLITVCFMAFDIRLQLEINIFWENNNIRPQVHQGNARNPNGQRRASREDMRRAALVAAAVYQQQRRRLIQEIRSQQTRQREQARRPSLPLQVQINAPLATAEDSDLEDAQDVSDSDTITCSHRSTTSEAGSFGSYEEETDEAEDDENETKRKKKTKRSRPSSGNVDDGDSSTDEDDDDNFNGGNGGASGGSSHGGGSGYGDDYDHDSDDMGDNSNGDVGGRYNSPLVVEVEIRHRPLNSLNNENDCQVQNPCDLFNLNSSSLYARIYSKSLLNSKSTLRDNIFTLSSVQYLL